jgi:formylglycine-generating enzyme required for sulfatase activity
MFSRKKQEPVPDFSDVHVKLKPVLGIPPVLYVSIIYALLILFVLFMLLLFPGIKSSGTKVDFTTLPDSVSVWIDGEYRGVTPCRVFVARGNHSIQLRKAFHSTVTLEEDFKGRLFGSLFVPLRREIRRILPVEDFDAYLEWTGKDFFQWGMLSQFSHDKQLPGILSETARASGLKNRGKMIGLLESAAYFADSPTELKELIRAVIYTEANNGIITFLTMQRIMNRVADFRRKYASFPLWLTVSLPAGNRLNEGSMSLDSDSVAETDWFKKLTMDYVESLGETQPSTGVVGHSAGGIINFEGLRFLSVPGGSFLSGMSLENAPARYFPYPVKVESFSMSQTEVTNYQFSLFLKENPEWSKTNLDALVEEARISDDYLASWSMESYPDGKADYPVVNVSHFAASAYCEWLTSKLPPALNGYTIRLPAEEEWEWAVKAGGNQEDAVFLRTGKIQPAGGSRGNSLGIKDLFGNVWEWCGDWYLPMKNLLRPNPSDNVSGFSRVHMGSERTVKGGSWANETEEIYVYTRGAQPPAWCTPYLGFRVVLTEG